MKKYSFFMVVANIYIDGNLSERRDVLAREDSPLRLVTNVRTPQGESLVFAAKTGSQILDYNDVRPHSLISKFHVETQKVLEFNPKSRLRCIQCDPQQAEFYKIVLAYLAKNDISCYLCLGEEVFGPEKLVGGFNSQKKFSIDGLFGGKEWV